MSKVNSLNTLSTLNVGGKEYHYHSIKKAEEKLGDLSRLPKSMKVLLENLLRFEDNVTVNADDIAAIGEWAKNRSSKREIQYRPARVLMQDFTGVPAVVDLAAMRDAMVKAGGDAKHINPLAPVDLVIDHSVMIDKFGTDSAFDENVKLEMSRNGERYEFLKWGQNAFDNFRVVPPGTGICHQVNLEYLSQVAWVNEKDGKTWIMPDTCVGTDSHTPMVNGLSVLAWGVGGIEAEAAILGQPISMVIPEVVGFKLTGKLKEGVTATDLVLTIVEMLRKKGVVGKFVEYYGDGLQELPLADRATISNMAPEYGATVGFFPVDEITLNYMRLTGRDAEVIARTEAYAKEQGFWGNAGDEPVFTDTLELDLSTVEPSMAGPKRPQDRVTLPNLKGAFEKFVADNNEDLSKAADIYVNGEEVTLNQGDVVFAAITSCTNTSNPSVMMAAGLVAEKAAKLGLTRKPWVKTSLAPGSKVVSEYLDKAGLTKYLDEVGFNLTGYGCTACIGNSGPLITEVGEAIDNNDFTMAAVISGNRNFEGRIHPQIKTNWIASPPLVVAFAIAGTTRIDIAKDPIAKDRDGNDVFLKDIWPSNHEIAEAVAKVDGTMFRKGYDGVFEGDAHWQALDVTKSETFKWNSDSTYVQHPPYFEKIDQPIESVKSIENANVLAYFGDSITTDHISPAGVIMAGAPAGLYLQAKGVEPKDFNSYGSRRGNHEVMIRGTFANIRIRNKMLQDVEGGYTKHIPSGETLPIYDAAMRYKEENTPLIVLAGKEYGSGSSRDWAAKGPNLLGVKAVIAESYERIHRSNLIGMGILALQYKNGENAESLGLTGEESFSIKLDDNIKPGQDIEVVAKKADGSEVKFTVLCRIDTLNEVDYYKSGGILHYVLRQMIAEHK
ncbi:aconitate hydratase AcnA [Ignatzschineria ureiclastica]|uniref:Aconitate hydratase n=1 Tax=Ignatzschineria ureiclastica TaxID=472582 RepID=A0A2U2ADY1_9GAMM|nr:aconitate hydratase AcnA [Ignatzschineria ureiclastica]PWD80864.1 aconitate hydratase AcnA [Ignatzschineria ureiclastica]GGZ94273.1 aconitate hydratase [Ignatzschineria ureiclastica]